MDLKQNRKVQEYIDRVCSHIKCREKHEEIKLELENHVEELAEEYLTAGISEDDALKKAISRMGDSALVGEQLNKIYKSGPEWSILILTLLFAASGLFSLYFIEVNGDFSLNTPSFMFGRSLIFTVLGLAVAGGLFFFDYRKLKPYSKYIYSGTIFILFLIIQTGGLVNGSVQHSFVQLTPIILVIALAGILDEWNWHIHKMFYLCLGMLALPVILMLAYPLFSAAVIYLTAAIMLLILTRVKLKYLLPLAGSGASLFLFAMVTVDYRMQRLLAFLNPHSDPLGSGYIHIQLDNLLQSAGFFGQGFTFSGMIPEVHTDFIFGYIVYTFGWLAGIVLIGLIAGFIARLISLAITIKDSYGRLLVISMAVIFSVQFIWNILMTLGLAPLGGVSLPFISYGNTQLIINMMMIGLILSVYKRKGKNLAIFSAKSL